MSHKIVSHESQNSFKLLLKYQARRVYVLRAVTLLGIQFEKWPDQKAEFLAATWVMWGKT